MKFFASVLIFALLVVASQARPNEPQKRLIGGIGSWINNNIINPIVDNVINPIVDNVINPVVDGANNLISSIGNPWDSFTSTVSDLFGQANNWISNAINDAVSAVQNTAGTVVSAVSSLFGGNGQFNPQGNVQDPCQTTCFQKINYNGQISEYFFDRPNGCVSKGFLDPELKVFDSCCDKHNECLNARCCTTDCQNYKNTCDTEYDNCLKSSCVQYIADNTKFYTCLARGAHLASSSVQRTCSATLSVNRKLCFC